MPHSLNAAASSARTAPSAARHSLVGATSGAGLSVLRPARARRAVDQRARRRGAGALRHDPAALVEEEAALLFRGFQAAVERVLLAGLDGLSRSLGSARAAPRSGKATPDRIVPSSVSSSAKRIGWQSNRALYASSSANARAEPATMLDKAAASAPSRRLLESQA